MGHFKTKRIGDGLYAISGTALLVSRDEKPRYGFPQEWSIVHKDRPHDPLLTGKGKADALERLSVIASDLWDNRPFKGRDTKKRRTAH